uniref:Dihydrodipicolinate synthase n=1 Tax=Anthurium amnicola TaxID=1678845 RepID=A0A1D1YKX7_9ARAE
MGVQRHDIGHPLEVVETVLEVADVAWNAYEHHRHRQGRPPSAPSDDKPEEEGGEELSLLRSENRRLRGLLADNLALLQGISESPSFSKDCPPDLYLRLVAAVDSSRFLNQLKTRHQESTAAHDDGFPFQKVTGEDSKTVDIMVNVGNGEPSLWVWVTEEMVPGTVEELSEIDNENYVIITEENVVDGIANFMARCILANPKSRGLTPEELQKTVANALGSMNDWCKLTKVWHAGKLLYCLSTWGIALAGLYRHRAIVKAAARGVGASGKLILKAF